METSYIVTFIGDDRPGLVEQLSAVIGAAGGNWQESRMTQLGGKFAGLVLVSLPTDSASGLETELKGLAASGLSVRVTPTASTVALATARRIKLSLIGPDRPGIVLEVSRALAKQQFNVVEMDSEVVSAPMTAEPLFQALIEADIAPDARLEELSEALEAIGNEMALDIDLEEILG
ncbi:glycine cleavage system protein R [Parahaliea mediterranea]|uniref:glycine cleavage system protein R n=1 Tax=Parahaliea mediterranea TaxID=651086 RepID=UPI000E2F89C0|nr:ACT domain-containing protein [Parahaliea mediterranea]